MQIVKRIGIALGILLLVLLGAALVLPILFKDELVVLAKQQINQQLDAKVEFEDISLSLFRDFPDLALSVKNFAVTGTGPFEGTTLVRGAAFDLTLDLWSVLVQSRPVELESVALYEPEVQVYILRNGRANYDIVKSDSTAGPDAVAADGTNLEVRLRSYAFYDGRLLYDDHYTDTYVSIDKLNHRGSGNFTMDVFDLETETALSGLTVRQGGVAYLRDAEASLDAVFNIDQANQKYTLKDNELRLNAFRLNGEGAVQLAGADYLLDLYLEAPTNDFKDLLSLIPSAYIEGYEDVRADGRFRFRGDIEGAYNGEQERYPAFRFELAVEDGSIQYPDLPAAITEVRAQASVQSPGSDLDDLVIDVPALHLRIGDHPFDARLRLETPISDPAIDGAVDGVIDLAELSRAFPMEGVETLTGRIVADIEADTRLSFVEAGQYDKVNMQGTLQVSDLRYRSEGMPLIAVDEAGAGFTPQRVNIQSFDARLGNSDLRATGAIDNLLAYFAPDRTMTGRLTLRADFFDVNEWYAPESEAGPDNRVLPDTTVADDAPFDRFLFDVDAEAKTIVYDDYRLLNTNAVATVAPNRIDIQQAATQIGESDFRISGVVTDAFDYSFERGVLGGQLALDARRINLNEFMNEEESETATAAGENTNYLEAIKVPPNIRLNIDADIDELVYTNITLRNLRGQVRIADESALINEARADALGGRIGFKGGYDTQDPDRPAFNLKFDLSALDFREAFTTVNTFQALAPIGRFIDGTFNSTLIMDGYLTSSLLPEFKTLNAEGFLQTFDATVRSIQPLENIGRKLNISELTEQWQISDSKNWFEVTDGMVEVKPFDIQVKGIPMTISGQHGLDVTTMDYDVEASIPRTLLRQSGIGQAADAGLSFLQEQAGQLGIDFQQGEYVNVLINLTGNMKDPNVGLKLLGTGGAGPLQESAGATLKEEAEKQLEAGRQRAEEKARELIDSAAQEAQKQVDSALEEIRQEAGKKLQEQGKDIARELLDSTATKTIDQIQEDLKKWNPFKKRRPSKDTSQTRPNGNE